MSLSQARSEGELIDSTIGREDDIDTHSRTEESPRRPGAPSFNSNTTSIAPITPVVAGVSGGSTRSIVSPKFKSRLGVRPRLLPRLKKRARALITRLQTPLSPFSWTARVRSFFLLLAFCVHTLGFPYENAFHGGGTAWFLVLDSVTEIIFFVDFLLVFNTSFVNKRGVLVVSRRYIAWNFLTGVCVVHFLAAIPFVMIVVVWKGGAERATLMAVETDAFGRFYHTLVDIIFRYHRVVHILRVLNEVGQVRGARIDKSVLGWLLYSRYSHLLRIVWIVGTVMVIAHCIACCWRLLLIDAADADLSSVSEGTCGAPVDTNVELEVYTECFYAAMQLLLGQSITTHSARENVFASCVNLLGSIVLAVIFGEVAMLVANFNANSTTYQRKMESVFAGMTKMQLPASLRERIHQYYAHLWREYEALDGASLGRFAKELSHNLTLEVVLFKYMELAMHVPFWENCSPDFQKTLVLSLDTRVYLPDDFIVRRGEVGDEFYMINRGMCELVGNTDTQEHATEPLARRHSVDHEHHGDTASLYTTSQDGTIYPDRDDIGRGARNSARYAYVSPEGFTQANVKTLIRGQAFGEMALLMNYQRTANVRAMTYVEMCVLSRSAFQAILTRYPIDRKHVTSQILISSLENNERFGIPCPLTATVRSVFADEIDGAADGEKLITPRRAAKLVAWAVSPDVEDDSIKFALSAKLKDQLIVVRDQEITTPTQDEDTPKENEDCQCRCHGNAENVSNPDDSHIVKLENAQNHALTLLQELQRGVQDSINPPSAPQQAAQATVLDPMPNVEAPKPVITIQQRRSRFISSRSTSAPNFADLEVTERRTSNLNLNEAVNDTVKPQETPPVTIAFKPLQRARTARWLKTSENTRPLRPPNSSPLVRPRAIGSSSRFIQRVTNQLASFATVNSTVQSPTMYADQLFGTTQSSLESAVRVNDIYGDDT
ncbi:Voltage-gated Ion Channel [Phytophthora megakarya]|uniref:Voltage-gated Ion Channel n=1 Tax=Phytophthora megakarya TaxID=4795 RepID=A0A225X037_9STRA|nr:Voltage-gated Ion Channel [Phytophthora megakarya]